MGGRLRVDPGFGPLLDLHGDDVLHGFPHVFLVEVRRNLPAFQLLKFLLRLAQLLAELLDFFGERGSQLLGTRLGLGESRAQTSRRLLDGQLAVLEVVVVK